MAAEQTIAEVGARLPGRPNTVAGVLIALRLPGDLAWLTASAAEERLCYCFGEGERFTVARLVRDADGWTLREVSGQTIAHYGQRSEAPLEWASGWLRIPRSTGGGKRGR